MLEAGRVAHGGPLLLTSYVRTSGGGAHADGRGSGLDVQPLHGGEDRIRQLADFFAAAYLRAGLVQVIYEPPARGQRRGHVHLARRIVQGATPGYLWEQGERYVYAPMQDLQAPAALPSPPSPALVAALGGTLLAYFAARILSRG